jgi:hypothetical protein
MRIRHPSQEALNCGDGQFVANSMNTRVGFRIPNTAFPCDYFALCAWQPDLQTNFHRLFADGSADEGHYRFMRTHL